MSCTTDTQDCGISIVAEADQFGLGQSHCADPNREEMDYSIVLGQYPLAGGISQASTWRNNYSTLFDGVNQYAHTPAASTAFDTMTTSVTVSLWIKGVKPAFSGGDGIFGRWNEGAANERGWIIQGGPAGADLDKFSVRLGYDVDTGGSVRKSYTSSIAVLDNTWHHIAFTWAGSGLSLYVDGVVDPSPTKTTDLSMSTIHVPGASVLGTRFAAYLDNGSLDGHFHGRIDEVSVYDLGFSAAMIAELYHDGEPADIQGAQFTWFGLGTELAYYRMGDGDTHPTLQGTIGPDATMVNTTSANIVGDVPNG